MTFLLKPTKITWIAFAMLVAANISAPFVGFYLKQITGSVFFDYTFILIPLNQVFGLMAVFGEIIGIDATKTGGSELFGGDPNYFGWTLIAISLMITLTVHYVLASVISRVFSKRFRKYLGDGPGIMEREERMLKNG